MERDTRQLASSLPPGSSTTRGDQGRHEQAKDGNAWPSGPNQLSGEMVTGRNSFLGVSGKSWKIPRTAGDLGARGVQAGLVGSPFSMLSTQLPSPPLSTDGTPSGHAAQVIRSSKAMLLK